MMGLFSKPILFYDKQGIVKKLNKKIASIDLGLRNTMTMYVPGKRPLLIKGGYINSLNDFYNKQISKCRSKIDKDLYNHTVNAQLKDEFKNDPIKRRLAKGLIKMNKIPRDTEHKRTSKKIRLLYIRRANKINDYFNKLVRYLVDRYKNIDTFIVGYNVNWKKGVNLGTTTNRKFSQVPYRRLINKLRDALELEGRRLIEREESYTSKCDALMLEPIEKHLDDEYLGTRDKKKRGLFRSGSGKLINADVNGAVNIMRKWCASEGKELKKINKKHIFNPMRASLACIL